VEQGSGEMGPLKLLRVVPVLGTAAKRIKA
jgi:hypothetical protein